MRHFLMKNIILQHRGPQTLSFHFLHRASWCRQFLCDFIIYWFNGLCQNYTLNYYYKTVFLCLKTKASPELIKNCRNKMKIWGKKSILDVWTTETR
jgi:hypothetical protein